MKKLFFALGLLALFVPRYVHSQSSHSIPSDWQKRQFINKAAKTLLSGAPDMKPEEMDELMLLSKEEVLDRFMQDELFYNKVMEFIYYYMKIPLAQIRTQSPTYGQYKDSPSGMKIFNFNMATNLAFDFAWAVKQDQDIFSAFYLHKRAYLNPTRDPYVDPVLIPGGDTQQVTRAEARAILVEYWIKYVDNGLSEMDKLSGIDAIQYGCGLLSKSMDFDYYGFDYQFITGESRVISSSS